MRHEINDTVRVFSLQVGGWVGGGRYFQGEGEGGDVRHVIKHVMMGIKQFHFMKRIHVYLSKFYMVSLDIT